MNVAELKKAIADLPDDLPVIMSSDGEGNSYSGLSDLSVQTGWEQHGWEWYKAWDDEEAEDDDSTGQTVVTLWPVN